MVNLRSFPYSAKIASEIYNSCIHYRWLGIPRIAWRVLIDNTYREYYVQSIWADTAKQIALKPTAEDRNLWCNRMEEIFTYSSEELCGVLAFLDMDGYCEGHPF